MLAEKAGKVSVLEWKSFDEMYRKRVGGSKSLVSRQVRGDQQIVMAEQHQIEEDEEENETGT